MGNPEPLHRLPDLPAVNAGRSAVLPAHLPEDLHRSSGAAVWHEPEQSQPVDPCSAASVARGAARSRRPLPHGFGAPPGCLGGAARGRAAAGACALPSLCLQSWAGLPPFAHDGTERRIPQNPAEQTQCYSGKKKDHTVKNILLVNAVLIILFLSDTVGGRIHDKRLAEATPYPLPAGSRLLQDLGFLAFTLPQVEILMPTKKPPTATGAAKSQPGPPLPPTADRACQQQCQALPRRQRPDPPGEAGRP